MDVGVEILASVDGASKQESHVGMSHCQRMRRGREAREQGAVKEWRWCLAVRYKKMEASQFKKVFMSRTQSVRLFSWEYKISEFVDMSRETYRCLKNADVDVRM